jgi:hypothetical protein
VEIFVACLDLRAQERVFLVSSRGPCSGVFFEQRFMRWVLGRILFGIDSSARILFFVKGL